MSERNLLWLDLEMTGLNVERDVILEIATTITDGQLTILAQGPSLVVHQPQTVMARMCKEVENIHTKSGLIDLVYTSNTTIEQAQQKTVAFLAQHAAKHSLVLAGNTVWQDRSFLVKYMPQVMEFLHYRIIDVTAIKELVKRWYPSCEHAYFKKADNHRAQEDVFFSIEELKHYRKHFFVDKIS